MRTLRVFTFLIIAAGTWLTGRALYLHAKAELAGVLIRRAWQETLRTGKPDAPWPWADTYPIARLEIPRLGYDEMVLEGATPRTLAFGPARLLDGAAPGEPGNLVLAGHRTSWFLPLKDIKVGDSIRLEWLNNDRKLRARSYVVAEIRIVAPTDTALLQPTAEDALTLITCYPFGSRPTSPQRFIVRATPAYSADLSVSSLR